MSSSQKKMQFGTMAFAACCLITTAIPNRTAAQVHIGATTPFTIVEAEAGKIGGGATVRTLNPTPANMASSPEVEASGRSFVQLNATGQYVSIVNPVDSCNTINIRQSIPDAPGGGGIDATLDMYVNGVLRMAIPLTSKQTIVYGGNFSQNPGRRQPYGVLRRIPDHDYRTGASQRRYNHVEERRGEHGCVLLDRLRRP